jgi:hypothetical protein
MEKEYQFNLIEGQFSPLEAGKVLFALINSKVNFHNLEIFSDQIRFEEENLHSKNRVQSLLEASKYLKVLIEEAKLKDMELNIQSVIQIGLSRKVKTASDV